MSPTTVDLVPARLADLTDEVCPMTFVKAKLHLEQLAEGETLEIVLRDGDHMRNVPRSLKEDGHRIEAVRREGERFHLLVRKGGP
jgi:tRNA 2-thiouridine synthesizing protein A